MTLAVPIGQDNKKLNTLAQAEVERVMNEANSLDPTGPQRILQAIESLKPPELIKLRRFAEWRMRAIGPKKGRSADDLFQEAFLRVLGKQRRWKDNLAFLPLLYGAIRSISNRWGKAKLNEILECDLGQADDQENHLSELHTTSLHAERVVDAKQELETVKCLFADDPAALNIINRMGQFPASEIKTQLGLTEKQYQTAMKRIRRRLAQAFPERCRKREAKAAKAVR